MKKIVVPRPVRFPVKGVWRVPGRHRLFVNLVRITSGFTTRCDRVAS